MVADANFHKTSRYDVMRSPNSPEAREFLRHAPFYIISDFLAHMPREKTGQMVAKNVFLINPILGNPSNNLIYVLYQNQLDWIAKTWADLCKSYENFGDAMDITPLLLGEGEFGMCVIDTRGRVLKVKV